MHRVRRICSGWALSAAIMEAVVERHRRRLSGRAEKITIDLDQTVDTVHGAQQYSLFNGHYRSYCFIPLLGAMTFNDEAEQIPIAAILRPGNSADKRGAIGVLRRLLPLLRKSFSEGPDLRPARCGLLRAGDP